MGTPGRIGGPLGGVFATKLHVDFTQSRRNVDFVAGVAMFGRSGLARQALAAMEVHGGDMWATSAATGIGTGVPLGGVFSTKLHVD